jgi:hypothetical protein
MFRKGKTSRFLWIVLLLACHGCSSTAPYRGDNRPAPISTPDVVEGLDYYWWTVRFKIGWPGDTQPNWSMGVLLADAVVKPVWLKHRESIPLWRFHRRAARDAAGHQFSFIFYAVPSEAKAVVEDILANPVLETLLARKLIETVKTDDTGSPSRSDIAGMSDPEWSPSLQKAWPPYIMGVSAAWLDLIDRYSEEKKPENDNPENNEIDGLLKRYRGVNESIIRIWTREGQHAFLHHLNAVFGYQPVYIRNMMKF